jgi:hypothetical protein
VDNHVEQDTAIFGRLLCFVACQDAGNDNQAMPRKDRRKRVVDVIDAAKVVLLHLVAAALRDAFAPHVFHHGSDCLVDGGQGLHVVSHCSYPSD